jgi:hypothetical protein
VRRDRQKLELVLNLHTVSTTFRCKLGGYLSNWTRLSSETGEFDRVTPLFQDQKGEEEKGKVGGDGDDSGDRVPKFGN